VVKSGHHPSWAAEVRDLAHLCDIALLVTILDFKNGGMNRTVEPIHRSADPPTELARQPDADQLQHARAKGMG